jgi:RNA polymerase sigma-70 factor (family 1)
LNLAYKPRVILIRTYSDRQLVASLKSGNEKAYDELFRRYWDKAFNAAYAKLKSKALAEEIVQDIFMDLWNKRASLSIESFSKYLYSSIRYQALNKIRSQLVHRKYWEYYRAFIPAGERTTEKTVHFNDLLNSVETCMNQLPRKTKKVFYLNKLEGRSLKEIASAMRLSEKAIEYHLTRSLKELKLYLRNTFLVPILSFLFL